MADDRCVHPEDAESAGGSVAGRAPGRWLDAETAERLLRGESLESVDAASRDQAERLAKTLAALTAEPMSAGVGLPGEEAALAAFRKVRAERTDDWVSPSSGGRHRAGDGGPADAGLVRIGAPVHKSARRRRPVHFGLAAVLAAGVVGGAAVVAATGTPGPSGEDDPDPGTSVSVTATPDRPYLSPPSFVPGLTPSPDASPSGEAGSPDTARGDAGAGSGGLRVRPGSDWNGAASACRDIGDGKKLAPFRKRSLEDAAGGAPRVWTYCKGVLSERAEGGTKAGPDGRKGTGKGGYQGRGDNKGNKDNEGDGKSGRGDGNGDSGGQFTAPRNSLRNSSSGTPSGSGTTSSGVPIASHQATMSPGPDPSPTYSAL
ncbi:hypothetical protein OHT57_31340 [Streptomyces sp. NBC_00285]|uniref:hypothetical protein n=1 Tax=Streptomyces sp. NBC_00285 TaxID=2975700 RepID=UPI002E2B72E9|nr:hypothetical protein [Streptomyces sp. NBC_00285]